MNVIEYCTEEVRRQGHDITQRDGFERVGWMIAAWCYALEWDRKPNETDAETIGELVEPDKNIGGFRRVGVRVGGNCVPPRAKDLPRLLGRLFDNRDNMTPMEFYKEFELIHPFVDGNGRTGKVLLNWLNGTLLDPIFPPDDLFGYPILNP